MPALLASLWKVRSDKFKRKFLNRVPKRTNDKGRGWGSVYLKLPIRMQGGEVPFKNNRFKNIGSLKNSSKLSPLDISFVSWRAGYRGSLSSSNAFSLINIHAMFLSLPQ